MSPRVLTRLAVVLAVAASVSVGWTTFNRGRMVAPPPFPCVATAKTGWLTAVTRTALLRIEWDEAGGRVGVSTIDGTLRWEQRSEPAARALALRVLEPISAPIRSSTYDEVSLFAGCDGIGAPWRGESAFAPSYRACVRPVGEGRVECLRRIFDDRKGLTDEAPGAVSDRITAEASARGLVLPAAGPRGARPSPAGPLLDDLLGLVVPDREEIGEDF